MLGRVRNSSGSGSVVLKRVCEFQQCSGSGLSGFTSEVRVFGFVGFGFKFCYLANKKLHKMHCQLINLTDKKLWKHRNVFFLSKCLQNSTLLQDFCLFRGVSGTHGFEVRVRVWSGLQISAMFRFGFIGFHFWSSGFRVCRVPTQH